MYPLNHFNKDLITELARELVVKQRTSSSILTGEEFERMFAVAMDTPYQRTFDFADVKKEQTGWGCKTLSKKNPFTETDKIQGLICKRVPLTDLDGMTRKSPPKQIGEAILNDWNRRVLEARETHPDLRIVVLLRNSALTKFSMFEFMALTYDPKGFNWKWNSRGVLEGYQGDSKKFSWVKSQSLYIYRRAKCPTMFTVPKFPKISKEVVLRDINYDDGCLTVMESPTDEFDLYNPFNDA
jgi:hypothetical protein